MELGSAAASLLAMAGAIAANQVRTNGVWNWPWGAAAAMLALMAVFFGWRQRTCRQRHTELRQDLFDASGKPLPLGQLTPRQLGVHPSRFGRNGDSPYVHRDADRTLLTRLRAQHPQLIIVSGPGLAGATSTLVHAAQTALPGYRLIAPRDAGVAVATMLELGRPWAASGIVIWLDDLSPSQFRQLDQVMRDGLPGQMWVLATARSRLIEGFSSPEYVKELLQERATVVELGAVSSAERAALRAEEAYAILRPALDNGPDFLMGKMMVALDLIKRALTLGKTEDSVDRVALVRAVTDWYRVAMPAILDPAALSELFRAYRREIGGYEPDLPVSESSLTAALYWATTKAPDGRPQLVNATEVGDQVCYVPHPLLRVFAENAGQSVADALWGYADCVLTARDRRQVGYAALDMTDYRHACQLLRHRDTDVPPAALNQLAGWLAETGHPDQARSWYLRCVATRHPDQAPWAMVQLGDVERVLGHSDQARDWFYAAIRTDHADEEPRALVRLAELEWALGHRNQARRLLRRAMATGHADQAPRAMGCLADQEAGRGNLDRACRLFRRVIATGHADEAPRARVRLGELEHARGNLDRARRLFRQAIATGHADHAPWAMVELGLLEQARCRPDRARRLFRTAICTRHPDHASRAMGYLADLEAGLGNLARARRWYDRTIRTDHADQAPRAMVRLGELERCWGHDDLAQPLFEMAVASGHPDHGSRAIGNLAVLEAERGNLDRARDLFRRAIATRHPDEAPRAMSNLGALAYNAGHLDWARQLFGQVIATQHAERSPEAMLRLATLERRAGHPDRARHWLRQAKASGSAEAAACAGRALRAWRRLEDWVSDAEIFGRLGWAAFADRDMMERASKRAG